VTVFNWIKAYGKKLDEIRSNDAIEVIEIDEMHTYIGSKKTIVGYGLLELGVNSSIAKLVPGELKLVKNFGKRLNRR
ncbi:MAG: hypothetical protein NZ551_04630, partial [Microscillaceae bacterium]|nr:hypothetical protein [Microscillaceae bacterium]MDW8460478.1 hypothetical protein [Cytophagales bacterium]